MKQKSKYRNVRGAGFDSKAEMKRHWELQQLQAAGQISELKRQVKIPLYGRDGPLLTPTGRHMTYIADWTYIENDEKIIEDKKGFRTEIYRIKRAILAAQGSTIRET